MLKKILFGLKILFCTGVCTGVLQYASHQSLLGPTAYAVDVNGVEVTEFVLADSTGFRATWFSSFDPPGTDTYYYNQAEGTSTTSGSVDTSHIFKTIELQIGIPTLASTTVTIRAEGKQNNATGWYDIFTRAYTAATTIDDKWPILERPDNFRVGAKEDDIGTNAINIVGKFITERKR